MQTLRHKTRRDKEFAARLRDAITAAGFGGRGGQTRLAAALREVGSARCTPQLVGTWMRGDRKPGAENLAALTTVLGISASQLVAPATGVPRRGAGTPQEARSAGKGGLVEGALGAQYGRNRPRDMADAFRALGDKKLSVAVRLLILKRWEEDFEATYGPGTSADFAETRAELEQLRDEERRRRDSPRS